ncbi:MAG: GNAT family N-acetyltransferase [Paracoccaceae bacterium]|jgi:ribosomal protein S18 acetylase RimI-like enzyme|nr:GNAT family N-acetyltransferase [Paracoccaceae bacterium]
MSIWIGHGLRPEHRTAAALLYWQAFGGKLGRVMGPEPKALRFIERVMSERHVITAFDATGQLLGVIGYRTHGGSFVGGDRHDLAAVYGRVGAAWRNACLAVLASDQEARVMIVDGLAVSATARGMGVGAALIEALCREAQARGYRELRLDVVGENLRARALYERLGFQVQRRSDSRLTALIFGFHTAFVMARTL